MRGRGDSQCPGRLRALEHAGAAPHRPGRQRLRAVLLAQRSPGLVLSGAAMIAAEPRLTLASLAALLVAGCSPAIPATPMRTPPAACCPVSLPRIPANRAAPTPAPRVVPATGTPAVPCCPLRVTPAPSIARATPTPVPSTSTTPSPPADPLARARRPARLTLLSPCQVIIGTLVNVGPEDDADTHIWLRPDPAHPGLPNAANVCLTPTPPALLLEIVPAFSGQPAAPSTAAACAPNPIARPPLRARTRACGG